MVFPSSSVLTAPQASVASPKADKPALNHMVKEKALPELVEEDFEKESRGLACRGWRCGQWPLAWWLCGRLVKVQVRRESDVGALARPLLQLESLAGLFFCSMRYSNLGSGISCLPFGAAPHGCPVPSWSEAMPPAAELETGGAAESQPKPKRARRKHRHSSIGFSRSADAIIDLLRQPHQHPDLSLFAPCPLKPTRPTMDSNTIKQTVMRQVQLESNTSNARMLIEVRSSARGTPNIPLRRLTQPARK